MFHILFRRNGGYGVRGFYGSSPGFFETQMEKCGQFLMSAATASYPPSSPQPKEKNNIGSIYHLHHSRSVYTVTCIP